MARRTKPHDHRACEARQLRQAIPCRSACRNFDDRRNRELSRQSANEQVEEMRWSRRVPISCFRFAARTTMECSALDRVTDFSRMPTRTSGWQTPLIPIRWTLRQELTPRGHCRKVGKLEPASCISRHCHGETADAPGTRYCLPGLCHHDHKAHRLKRRALPAGLRCPVRR